MSKNKEYIPKSSDDRKYSFRRANLTESEALAMIAAPEHEIEAFTLEGGEDNWQRRNIEKFRARITGHQEIGGQHYPMTVNLNTANFIANAWARARGKEKPIRLSSTRLRISKEQLAQSKHR